MKILRSLSLVLIVTMVVGSGSAIAADDIISAAYRAFEGGIRNMFADRLYEIMCDGDPEDDPLIIDVRTPADYERGHITGAVRYDLEEIFHPDVLKTLPTDRRIVVYCYVGQTSSWAVGVLRMMGYDAYNLFYGMSGWTTNPDIYVRRFDASTVPDYPTVTEPAFATETYELPTPIADTVIDAVRKLFSEGIDQYNVTATQVYEWLHDENAANDPMVVSLRQARSYERGHIEGAINIDPEELFTLENLSKLPPDRPIVICRYTGQGSAKATAALRILGYDAYNMQFGMGGWTADPNVYVQRFEPADVKDYRTEGTIVSPVPPCAPAALPATGGAASRATDMAFGLGLLGIGLGIMLRRRDAHQGAHSM